MTGGAELLGIVGAAILAIVGLVAPGLTVVAILLLTAALCAFSVLVTPRRWAGVPAMYMWFFAAFHTALLLMLTLGLGTGLQLWQSLSWLSPEVIDGTARILLVAEAGLMTGLCLASLVGRGTARRLYCSTGELRLTIVGGALLATGLIAFVLVFIQVNGPSLIGGGYELWRDAAESAVVSSSVIMLLIMFGMVLLAAGGPSRARTGGFIGFAVWAVISLLLGNRSEVVIPIAAVIVVIARQRRLAFHWYYVLVLPLALTAGAWVRVARSGLTGNSGDVTPLAGLAEMGATLRTVVESWRWHATFNESYVGWRTYWRLFGKVFPGQGPLESDPNVFGQTILARVGAIGGSPVAEAYHSAGMLGAFIVLMVVGLTLMTMELWSASAFSNAIVGGLQAILLLWVRNDFTPVVAQVGLLVVLVGIAWLLPVSGAGRAGPSRGLNPPQTTGSWRPAE